jgi:hypothetical protein
MAELDEFGIPKKSTTSQTMDEYGIPVKKKDSTVLSSSDGQSSLPLASEFERGQGLADNSFLKQIGKDAALSHAYPSGMVDVENPVDISLKEKAPKKDYYSTKLDKGLIFDKQGKLYAPSSEVLTTKIPRLKEEEITIKKTPQKDLVEQAREMPIEQPKVEEPVKEGEWGFDKAFKNTDNIFESLVSGDLTQANLVQNIAANFELAGTKMAKGAALGIRDLSSGLSYLAGQGTNPELFENGKPTKYAESATWLNDPLGKVALGLQGNEKRMQSVISNNKLPDTFLGNAVASVASFAPDLAATALLPEAKIAEGAGIIKTIGSQLINNFTKYMTVKGGVEGYGEARSQGKGAGEASVEGLKGAGSGFENGVEMAMLGAGSNLATKGIMSKAEQIGLKGTAAHVTRELVNLGTDVTAYALLGPQAHAALEGKWITAKQIAEGTGVAALFRLKGAAENIKSNAELNEAIKQTQELKQGVAISNFVDADHAAIERVYYTKGTANDLQLEALDFAKKAKDTSDLQKKAEYIAKSMTSARAANVKQVTEDILNNPDSLKKFEESDLPDNIKQQFLQKADEIKKMLDPIEQQKTSLGQDIKDTTDFIKQATDKMNAETDPVKKKELEVRIKDANKFLEDTNNKLEKIIVDQNKSKFEEDLTTDDGIKKAKKEFNKTIDEQIASLDKKSPDYENDLEALNKKKEEHNDHYDTLLKTKAPVTDEITHPIIETKVTTEQPADAKTASDLVSVSVAPYYDTQIEDLSDASKLRGSEGYKKHIEMLKKVAKSMGLNIESIDNTVGGFENDKGNKITEISNRVKLNTNDLDAAERYAAVVGALAHETQEATIAARYVEHGDPNQSAIETEIKVSDLKNAVNSLKEAGIHNFEVNENDNSIKILDFDNGKSDDFNNKMVSFADLLDKNNIQYETEHHAIESRYVDPERRSELLKEAKLQAEQQKGRTKLRNLYEKSTAKSEEFLNKKAVPPAEIPEEVHNSIVNRIKKGIQKLSDKAKVSVLSGKNFAKALEEAIKTGGANLQAWGGFEKKGFEESPEWQKLIDNGTVKLNFDIKGLEGKPVVVINPDNMLTGAIVTKNGKPIVDGNGGINFVTKFGDVWASSDNATANTLAKYINEARQKDIDAGGDGTIHVVVTKGDLSKSLTSHTGAKAAMKVLEHFVDKKLVSLSDFRKALTEVGKKYNIDFDGRLDAKSIHDDIAKKFFGVNDSTFSKRGFFVQDVIDNLAKNSKSAKENIGKIRELLNTEALPKSTERKTGEISFAKEGIIDAIGHLLSDNMTVGVKNSEAYATIEIKHPVKVIDLRGKEEGHESYPFHLQQVDENGNKVKPVLNVLKDAKHVTDILNDANNNPVDKKGGAGKFGSNQIGMAKGFVKPASEHPTGVNMMTDATGKIYGFEQNGKIVLNADLMNGNTPFHEAGHLWLSWAKENRSDLHDAGMAKIENSTYLKDVKNNKVYQENAAKLPEGEREAYFKSEALAKAIGDNGEKFVNEAQKSDFKKWVKQLWESVAAHFGLRDMSADDISKMTLDEFSKKVVGDIISPESQKTVKEEVTTEEKAPIEFSVEEAYNQLPKAKKLRENAQKTLINSNFDKIVEQLIKNDKIQKKC